MHHTRTRILPYLPLDLILARENILFDISDDDDDDAGVLLLIVLLLLLIFLTIVSEILYNRTRPNFFPSPSFLPFLQDAADMVRRNRADQIESKQRQRDRYRAEVYAVNAILKKLEMSRFDELRQERGSDRSFLEQCSTDDDETSMEDNACNDNNDSSNNSGNALSDVADRPITTITTTTTTTSTSTSTSTLKSAKLSLKGRDASKDRGRTGKDASSNKVQGGVREPVQSRGSKQAVSSRKLHLSSSPSPSSSSSSSSEQQQQLREKQKQREKHPSGGGATQEEVLTLSLQEKYQCPPHYVAPPSTSESEVCNFSFGV